MQRPSAAWCPSSVPKRTEYSYGSLCPEESVQAGITTMTTRPSWNAVWKGFTMISTHSTQQMWRRLNDSEPIYRETAAQYFNLMLESVDILSFTQKASPLLLALAMDPALATAVVTDDIESWGGATIQRMRENIGVVADQVCGLTGSDGRWDCDVYTSVCPGVSYQHDRGPTHTLRRPNSRETHCVWTSCEEYLAAADWG